MGQFDDLIPAQQQSVGAFDDLIPRGPAQAPAAPPVSSDRIGGPWGSVLDYFDLQKQAQAPEQRSFGAKALTAAGTVAEGLVPHSFEQAGQLAEYPVKMLPSSQVYESAKRVYDYTQGKPALEAATQDIPIAQRVPQYLNAPDSQGRFNAVAGGLADASMFLPMLHGEAVPNVDAAVRESMAPKPDTAPPAAEAANVTPVAPQQGTVRLYHGGAGEQAGSDFTTSRQYSEDYAAKTPGGKVWSVDVPEGTLKTHDEYGQPMTRVVVPDEIANQAKPLQPETTEATIPTPDELSSSQAQAGQRDTALRAEPEPAAVGGAGAPEGTQGGRGAAAGTSNRQNVETYGEGAVPSGTGVDTGQLLDSARAAIRSGGVDPYSVLSKTREKGVANPEEYAALAAEHERLVNDAVAKEKAGDPAAQEAAQQANDFANAIQPHKTAASDLFRLMQGDLNYDLSTSFGIDQYMKSELGRGLKPEERPMFDRHARGIRQAESGVADAVARSDARVRSRYAKVADIPMEDAAARVREWLSDCVV